MCEKIREKNPCIGSAKILSDDHQGDIGHDIKNEDADFIQRHAAIVDGIESFFRNLEPATMHAINKAAAKDEKCDPPE